MKTPIYLDYAATTPCAPEVVDVMQSCLAIDGTFANPVSRSHFYGWQAEAVVEKSRKQVASLLNADTREIIWTSGATEANNLALKVWHMLIQIKESILFRLWLSIKQSLIVYSFSKLKVMRLLG